MEHRSATEEERALLRAPGHQAKPDGTRVATTPAACEGRSRAAAAGMPHPARVQATLGNQAALRLQRSAHASARTTLAVSAPGEAQERQADAAAELVLRAGDAGSPVASGCVGCDREPRLQRREVSGASTATGLDAAALHAATRAGAPLPAEVRRRFEPGFGRDLGAVRVHTVATAAASARAIGALAYTHGRDVVFAAGRYAPGTPSGDRLLAHELAHVAQQFDGAAGPTSGGVVLRQVGGQPSPG
jgi:hypothetical protein